MTAAAPAAPAAAGEKKAPKKEKPTGPKRPTSAYFFFSNETRAALSAKNPGMPVSEIAKLLGAKWKELSADAKKPYEVKAEADKKRYEAEKAKAAA